MGRLERTRALRGLLAAYGNTQNQPTENELWAGCKDAAIEIGWLLERMDAMQQAAKHLDHMILRTAFDAQIIEEETVHAICVDPWGVLKDFREAFGLGPLMSPEEWTQAAVAKLEADDG